MFLLQTLGYIALLALGFFLLIRGADWFVDGASGIAKKLHVSELIIGLTIVAIGTSLPEFSVSLTDALGTGSESGQISIANAVGSNLTNILLILGVTSILAPIAVKKSSYAIELPFLLAVSALLVLLGSFNNQVSRMDGLLLFLLMVLFIVYTVLMAKKHPEYAAEEETADEESRWKIVRAVQQKLQPVQDKLWFLIVTTIVGAGVVVGGSQLAVFSAKELARSFGVHERVIGLTIVALGTSLPELITNITAAKKGKTDLAIGNIIGSNIFNILMVVGVSAIFKPIAFEMSFVYDGILSVFATLLLFLFSVGKRHRLGRTFGVVALVLFTAYYFYIFALEFGLFTLPASLCL